MAVRDDVPNATTPNEIADRTRRAATERMAVALDAPGVWEVYSEPDQDAPITDDSHVVSLVGGEWVCTCRDHEYREPDDGCKHIRRVQFLLGERRVPEIAGVDPLLKKRLHRGVDP